MVIQRWETFLEAVIQADFAITGTWPMRTERGARSIGIGANALASSIVLVCRKRAKDASTINHRELLRELNAVLPEALDEMTCGGVHSPVVPVGARPSSARAWRSFRNTPGCWRPTARRCA